MNIKKNGRFLGVKIIINREKDISAFLYIKFKEGIYSLSVDMEHNIDTVINNLVDKYNLGITNMYTKMVYADYDKMIYFSCHIWDCEENILQDMITELDEDVKEFISSLLSNVKPNCRIDNIGFGGDMNSLSIIGGLPETACDLKKESSFDEKDWGEYLIQKELGHSLIRLSENVIVSYTNSWANEWWNGPQSYGGFTRISETFTDSGCNDYDYDMKSCKDAGTVYWDENTLVSLEGNNSNGIIIVCNLKNIKYFKGMLNSSSIRSGILSDIELLLKAEFETHEHYVERFKHGSLKLISIDKMESLFEEYNKYMLKRHQKIFEDALKLYGSEDLNQREEDNVL